MLEKSLFVVVPKANDWMEYQGILKVKNGSKLLDFIEMKFVSPHQFLVNIPLEHTIDKAERI